MGEKTKPLAIGMIEKERTRRRSRYRCPAEWELGINVHGQRDKKSGKKHVSKLRVRGEGGNPPGVGDTENLRTKTIGREGVKEEFRARSKCTSSELGEKGRVSRVFVEMANKTERRRPRAAGEGELGGKDKVQR